MVVSIVLGVESPFYFGSSDSGGNLGLIQTSCMEKLVLTVWVWRSIISGLVWRCVLILSNNSAIVRMLRLWLADLRVALLFFLLYIVVYEGVGRVLLYWVLECVPDIYIT